MAKIVEEQIIITLSKIVKNNDDADGVVLTSDLDENIESIVQELVGNSVTVEVTRG